MRKILSFALMFSLLLGGILVPQSVWAGQGHEKPVPPGLAKKIDKNIDLKGFARECYKGFKLTRAEFATIIAQKDADFQNFQESKEIREKINDWKAIPEKHRKAVCFVVSKKIMENMYKSLPNGQIVFQPNKPVTIPEFLWVLKNYENSQNKDVDKDDDENVNENEVIYQGTVRLVEKIGNNTWITIKNAQGLFSAYFLSNTVPSDLATGLEIKIKVDKTDNRIIKSSLKEQEAKNLLTSNQSSVEQNLSGFSSSGFNTYAGATLQKTTSEKWQGKSSLQVTTTGYNAWQGVNIVHQNQEITGPNTFSFYVKGTAGTPMRVVVYDNDNAAYPTGGILEFTATGEWQRKAVTFTPIKASKNVSLQITLDNSTKPTVYFLDGLQLEKGNKATTWVSGD